MKIYQQLIILWLMSCSSALAGTRYQCDHKTFIEIEDGVYITFEEHKDTSLDNQPIQPRNNEDLSLNEEKRIEINKVTRIIDEWVKFYDDPESELDEVSEYKVFENDTAYILQQKHFQQDKMVYRDSIELRRIGDNRLLMITKASTENFEEAPSTVLSTTSCEKISNF